jgi:flagellar biosynthesis protein FlhA
MTAQLRARFGNQSDLLLVLAVVGILLVLFTPIPSVVLDLLLIINVSAALLILLLTFYVEKPLEFSTFPSILLIATLFRLSLNVAAARLILNNGDAGKVIAAIGNHVVAGNYVVGLIVFLVLIVVQYVVVTNGAQRVAEVAARFTLDSMPGKQMSIDADMNIGLIDEAEAKRRRREIEKEGNFYGAMDGASKFVKGDAIAGIIIILIDIIGGLTIGIAQRGLDWSTALHTYTLLTVGDGIVTQIPALIISTGTGIIVTRAASDAFLSKEISSQLTAYPKTLLLIAAGLLFALALPGIPAWPVLLVSILVGALAFYGYRRHGSQEEKSNEATNQQSSDDEDIHTSIAVQPILIEVGSDLVNLVGEASGLMERIVSFRKQLAHDTGFVVPKVKFADNGRLKANEYQISIYGTRVAQGNLYADKTLAINPGNGKALSGGMPTKEPTYGLPALWIDEELSAEARQNGYTLVDPQTVLITHMGHVFRKHSPDLLSRQETEALVGRVARQNKTLVEELLPNILSLSDVQKILQNLLREDVSIRNLELILEVLIDQARANKDPITLTEAVRQRLASQICQTFSNSTGDLFVMVLDPSIEKTIAEAISKDQSPRILMLEPRFAEQVIKRIATQVEKMMAANHTPVLLCGAEIRAFLKDFIHRAVPHLRVLSMSEIANNVKLKSFGIVTI